MSKLFPESLSGFPRPPDYIRHKEKIFDLSGSGRYYWKDLYGRAFFF
ncbi:hypothetical protein LEP1GSC061_0475 [Leptospira wolffii serovar Khorat str. Khorat-H2]|nr:hypothetical protein LEP1GSC061_0475 [Leptospira wolffii serovar Khorat str. Khorat-H2]